MVLDSGVALKRSRGLFAEIDREPRIYTDKHHDLENTAKGNQCATYDSRFAGLVTLPHRRPCRFRTGSAPVRRRCRRSRRARRRSAADESPRESSHRDGHAGLHALVRQWHPLQRQGIRVGRRLRDRKSSASRKRTWCGFTSPLTRASRRATSTFDFDINEISYTSARAQV